MLESLRREPYRLFFPLGLALAWSGVLHWLLHAAGWLPDYRPVFHAIAQIQGFMTSFAVGFLLTMIPRRTGTAPPSVVELVLGAILPVATTLAAWFEMLAWSQVAWLLLVGVLASFAIRRFLSGDAGRRPPNSFVWIPVAFGMGVAGSLMTSALGIFGPDYQWMHDLGQRVLLQGMFLGLTAGVGGMVFPLLTRGDPPSDGTGTARDRLARSGHLAAAALLALSFWIEIAISLRGGLLLRGMVMLLVLVVSARIWRVPRIPGWHRWLVWLSAWLVPAGYVLATLFPAQKKAGLHVAFIGGFAMMAFSVALHVVLAHGGYERLVRGRPWQVPVYGTLLIAAAGGRALVDFDPNRFFFWIGLSAAAFLLASLFWAILTLPRLR